MLKLGKKQTLVIVKEVEFDYDLHNLEVYNGEKYLGKIYPHTTEVMEKMFEELDNGTVSI